MKIKRVFLVHRWSGKPDGDWFPWLKKELERYNFEVFVLDMPDTSKPKIGSWINAIKEAVVKLDTETYFVGHSIGCQTILRYLENCSDKDICGGAVFVAGWFDLLDTSYDNDEDREIIKPWVDTQIDFRKAKRHLNKSTAIFSDNDIYVSLDQSKIFEKKLGSKVIVQKDKGHFTEDDGIRELPVALTELLRISK
jgi:predicted alpha/beta hydrolase family esterase